MAARRTTKAERARRLAESFDEPEPPLPEPAPPAAPDPPAARVVRVMAIDPGTRYLACFVLDVFPDRFETVFRERFTTSPEDEEESRLDAICLRMHQWFAIHLPDVLAVERVHNARFRQAAEGKGSAKASRIQDVAAYVRAFACLYARRPCYEIASSTARVAALGRGNTRGKSKHDAREGLRERLGVAKLSLDEADAGALALAGYDRWLNDGRPLDTGTRWSDHFRKLQRELARMNTTLPRGANRKPTEREVDAVEERIHASNMKEQRRHYDIRVPKEPTQ